MYTIEIVEVITKQHSSEMEVFLFKPDKPAQKAVPGIILAQHIPMGHTGLENDPFTLTTAQRLADNGYTVAVPFIFHWWPKNTSIELKKNESRDDWIVADMQAGFDCLEQQDHVDVQRIGMVGHCWGGRVAWLAAAHQNKLKALAVFYGGNIKKILGEGNQSPFDLTSKIPCPVIGFFGNNDVNPTPAEVEDYRQSLVQASIPHEFHQYDGAGHAFQNFPMPERYHQGASYDAWEKLLVFLANSLGDNY